MKVRMNDLVLVQGMRDTRATLSDWNRRPGLIAGRWAASALAVAVLLLLTVWAVAALSNPDAGLVILPGLDGSATLGDAGNVLFRNSLVLALHAFACLAGFIAGSSLPQTAQQYSGAWRWIHDKAGPLAIAFVIGATTFSLVTQAYVLGGATASLAAQLDISPGLLLLGLLPHALPELTALFLPLAAWMIASRAGNWHQLLAATVVTVALAAPVLVVSALVEVYVSPQLLLELAR
ncbi:MAG: stage II sporulation protein M [Solirubrobacteraceae bacterium]